MTGQDQPLYQQILGDVWPQLPAPVRELHTVTDRLTVAGQADIDRGRHPLSFLVAAIMGFPPAGHNVPLTVTFTVKDGVEHWQRDFNGVRFHSWQYADGQPGRIRERFGPFVFTMALVLENGRMNLIVKRWTFLGIPLPVALSPNGEAWETGEEGRFRFHVEIRLPLVGLIVRYRGWLKPVSQPGRPQPTV
ncbi:MAG: DUF4166 domain-containing protein [Fluviicoccus sp.]|uniref:DUF4166 domain-containing protein n=1 Tax=Fluviicoccus sp. TaxID=2003552 RepID=UPI00271C912F|nr:DUF4166 domain-containing protein [Fluviicoccus sp.]MDO8332156.1 DUF4166 domain-containing protein [Fluviicoccus sp.]